jgi:DNA-binding transcriptional regulator GbsR (MarR family)
MGTVYNAMYNVPSDLFSPFSPSTYQELNKEISNMASNLEYIEKTCNTPERKNSLMEKVVDHTLYLLDQKYRHLEAIQKLAVNTPISETNYDDLVEKHRSLVNDVNSLSKKLNDISSISLSNKK